MFLFVSFIFRKLVLITFKNSLTHHRLLKHFFFPLGVGLYLTSPRLKKHCLRESIKMPLTLIKEFSNKDRYKVNVQKSIPSLNTSNKKVQNIMEKGNRHITAQQKITRINFNKKYSGKRWGGSRIIKFYLETQEYLNK